MMAPLEKSMTMGALVRLYRVLAPSMKSARITTRAVISASSIESIREAVKEREAAGLSAPSSRFWRGRLIDLRAFVHKPDLTFQDNSLTPVDLASDPVLKFATDQG